MLLLYIVYAVLALVAALVLLLLVAGIWGGISLWRSIRIAAKARCPHCNTPFGKRAVHDARKRYAAEVEELLQKRPGVRIRRVVRWSLVCENCGKRSLFWPSSNTLVAEDDGESSEKD